MVRNWILLPASTMCLGWVLRAYLGGGPFGAMIPGALVAAALCFLAERGGEDAVLITAFGAIGMGFGGQLTSPPMAGPGGLALQGAVSGLLGGAVLALAFIRHRYTFPQIVIGVLAMGLATQAGVKLIDLWAGLGLGAIALLGWLNDRVMWTFAKRGALFGALGFAAGVDFLPGAMLGAAFGSAAWRCRLDLARRRKADPAISLTLQLATGAVVVTWALLAMHIPGRASYTLAGTPLLLLAIRYPSASWQIVVMLTYTALRPGSA